MLISDENFKQWFMEYYSPATVTYDRQQNNK